MQEHSGDGTAEGITMACQRRNERNQQVNRYLYRKKQLGNSSRTIISGQVIRRKQGS